LKKKSNSWKNEKNKSHEEIIQPHGEAEGAEVVVAEAAGAKNNNQLWRNPKVNNLNLRKVQPRQLPPPLQLF